MFKKTYKIVKKIIKNFREKIFSYVFYVFPQLKQHHQILWFINYVTMSKISILFVFYVLILVDFFYIFLKALKKKLNNFKFLYYLKRLKTLFSIGFKVTLFQYCSLVWFVKLLFNFIWFLFCITFGLWFLFVGSGYLLSLLLMLWFVQLFLYFYRPQKYKNNWIVSFTFVCIGTLIGLFLYGLGYLVFSMLINEFGLNFYFLSQFYIYFFGPQNSFISVLSRCFLFSSFSVCFGVFFKIKFFAWRLNKLLEKKNKIQQKLQNLDKKIKLSSNYILPSVMLFSETPQKLETSEEVTYVLGIRHTESYPGVFFERFITFEENNFKVLCSSWFSGNLCNRHVRFDVVCFPIPKPEHPGYRDLSIHHLTEDQILSHIDDRENLKQDLISTINSVHYHNKQLAYVKHLKVKLEKNKSQMSLEEYSAKVVLLSEQEELNRGVLRNLEFVFNYIINRCPFDYLQFYMPPSGAYPYSPETCQQFFSTLAQNTSEIYFKKNWVFINNFYQTKFGIKFKNFFEFKLCQIYGLNSKIKKSKPENAMEYGFNSKNSKIKNSKSENEIEYAINSEIFERLKFLEKSKVCKKEEFVRALQNASKLHDKRTDLKNVNLNIINLYRIDLNLLNNNNVHIEDLLKKAELLPLAEFLEKDDFLTTIEEDAELRAELLENKQINSPERKALFDSLVVDRLDEITPVYDEEISKAKAAFEVYHIDNQISKKIIEAIEFDDTGTPGDALRNAVEARIAYNRPFLFLDSKESIKENSFLLNNSKVFLEKSQSFHCVFLEKTDPSFFKFGKDDRFFLENNNSILSTDFLLNNLL